MIGRIQRPADFERVLTAPQRSRSPHFAIHHVPGSPGVAPKAAAKTGETGLPGELSPKLSTDGAVQASPLVEKTGLWLGLVVPKRLARRAVTRNLIKRQVRAVMSCAAPSLPPGLWVVRLRAPFDRAQFLSPGSDALRAAAGEELRTLFDRAIHAPLAPQPYRPRRGPGKR